jgi:N-acetyl-anhydromuramyl-L-alanine amidase AmpD
LKRYGLLLTLVLLLAAPAGAVNVERPHVLVFRGDGNYTKASRRPSAIRYVVVHVTEGRFWGSVDWLQNDHAEASANYVVSRAGKIVQLVHLSDIAWHSGNALMNRESVGIEHAGVTDDPAGFTMRQYRASAQLAAWICRRSLIPIDRKHLIGHSEVPGADHTDPGRYWNWPLYLRLVKQYAYPKPFPKLRVASTTLYAGQVIAGSVPWKAVTTGPKATRVDFLVDGKLKWSDHRAPFVFAAGRPLKTLAMRNGRHTLKLVAYGRSGHSAARSLPIRVLNRKLELTTAGVARHARVAGVVKLRANTTVATPAIRLFLDGRLVQQAKRKPFSFSLDVRKLVNGTHTLDLRATAVDGRSTSKRIPVVVANPLPVPPPALVSQSLANGQVVQGPVQWQVEARNAARVEFVVDGSVRATVAAAPWTFAWDTTPEPAGAHTLVVRVYGQDGRVVQSAPVAVTVAAAAPPAA